jgi:methyl-accepting chemotaxis protein
MTSNARITAAFVLGGGAVLLFVAAAAAAGGLEVGSPSNAALGVIACAAVALVIASAFALDSLRRGQRREQDRIAARNARAGEPLAERLAALHRSASELADGAGSALALLARAAEARQDLASQACDFAKSLRAGVAGRTAEIERTGQRIRESAAAVAKMDRANGRALELINGLAVSIEQASLATREGDSSARNIARDLDDLANGVRLARGSLDAVKDGAEHACADARHVANTMASLELESQRIGETIEAVISGSDAALASNDRILDVTGRLESRLGGIDDVIGVIRNLADRTKLLSINASIIATEAGEHGRAFAVVANEIKDLAGSTSRAISEISSILSALQEGYGETVQVILRSREDVDRGVSVARNAVEMIRSIPEQVHITAALSNEIVMRNEDQVKKGVEIAATFERMSAAIGQVGELLRHQVSRDEATLEMYLAIGRSSEHVHRAAKEHATASVELVRVIDGVGDAFSEIGRHATGESGTAEKLVELCGQAERQMDDLRRSAREVSAGLGEIVQHSRSISPNDGRRDGALAAPTPRPETAA